MVSTQGLLVKVSEGPVAYGVGVSQRTVSVCHSLLWRLEGPRGGLLIIKVQARIGCSLMPDHMSYDSASQVCESGPALA